ncbi:ectoine/hydroxyectoine ABC transporter substrate-binding protein EhuB [Ensifer adhaerens]|uniref:ectoine/hydroxyectoine ABC transporter substrate-binding protein EhuB n=1 Tax=Ensifer adhaerens TaxID=106592 RepID=UPI001CC078B1|nr:ectoine/hydroxyectoine ABC transporter substrate-binding protein EhuB [Ensifer adhaerens]MBZ7924276.1 ectoine/hydroxyectoine ABC transporter substrate-binding protein EhuB [Ensifer adhaerens]UAX96473.1 ectoine/hydroxyectoine ABC transporter substrate-binding protein EhuB [Ensifer adhaerens]UAY04184.1 ectoine/hydroxyectoine ABC transporter substrate-binding protein EhuB [Ensifer adhaerens]UAY12170.1 ectoine/hydroxyectoine ABC transporter substrate-binding protein EhuB [Ensifer adhaerens]
MSKANISRRYALKAVVLALAATSFAVSAHAESTLERARAAGYIRIGFANEAPFGFATPDGKLSGEAPEVAKAVLKRMGIAEVDGVLTEFGSLIPGLKAGRFDIIAAGMFINPKRCGEIAFSEPSYGIGQAMLVPKGNPKAIKDYSSFAGHDDLKLAVMAGAVEGGYAKDAGIATGQLVTLPDQSSLVAAVQSGRADAAALTALSIADMAKKAEGVESTEPFGEVAGKSVKGHGGFGFRKDDVDFVAAFNKELAAFLGTPEHIALVEPFGFGKGYLPNKTTKELCAGE